MTTTGERRYTMALPGVLPEHDYDVFAYVHGYPPGMNAGAEWMLHSMLRALVADGLSCAVWALDGSRPTRLTSWDGVDVYQAGKNSHAIALHARVLVSHLAFIRRVAAYGRRHQRPVVYVAHNERREIGVAINIAKPDLVVHNSRWVAESLARDCAGLDQIVVRPPVFPEDYRTAPGDRITLINLCESKGSDVFHRLAGMMPDVAFLGCRGGYGRQDVRDTLPNVAYTGPTMNMRGDVYARTRILLVPSAYESWGRVAVEAMCSGIPVIAHPTPGLREACGDAATYVDRDDLPGWEAAIRAVLDGWGAASAAATRRAAELDPAPDLAVWVSAIRDLLNRRG